MEYEDKPWEYGARKPIQKAEIHGSKEVGDRPWMKSEAERERDRRLAEEIAYAQKRFHLPSFDFTMIDVITFLAIIGVIAAVIGYPMWRAVKKVSDYRWVTATVSDKGTKRHDDNERYLIYTTEGTFEITDSLFAGRFDSSDLYGKIEVGKTYQMYIAGERHPFLTMYPNLYEIKEVEGDATSGEQ